MSEHARRLTVADLWRRGQVGWPRPFPLVQFPNKPLLVAGAGAGLAAAADGAAHDVGQAIFTIGFGVWAWDEALHGINWFRHLLGGAALVWLVVRLASEL